MCLTCGRKYKSQKKKFRVIFKRYQVRTSDMSFNGKGSIQLGRTSAYCLLLIQLPYSFFALVGILLFVCLLLLVGTFLFSNICVNLRLCCVFLGFIGSVCCNSGCCFGVSEGLRLCGFFVAAFFGCSFSFL